MLFAAGLWAADTDYKIDRGLMAALSDDSEAAAPFFVVFGERAELKPAYRIANRAQRGRFVVQALEATANRSQAGVRGYLQSRRVAYTAFWVENKIYVPQGTLELARELARRPEVVAILPEVVYTIPQPLAEASIQSIEWNIAKIRADQVWPTTRGAGTVVANIDTGVQYTHPALVAQYRGNTGGSFTHPGNWRDPANLCATPCDNNGHGTHTMGTMVGDDGGTNQIGVAPGARWIACRGCRTNSCFSSDLTTCAQWILDPLGNSSGANQPDVVNNSWGGGGGNSWYQSRVQSWRAAGIFPAFSNGNSGPNCSTSGSPGDYPESFASGATSSSDAIASFSSRGPSAFGGIIKPNVSAPGVSVRSSVPTNSYSSFSGTSMASPHTGGTVALVWSAAPALLGNIGGTEQVLKDSAVKFTTTQTCGGIAAGATPNNTYGWGRIDALAAVQAAGGPINQPPTVTISSPANGSSFNCPVSVNFTGTASDLQDGNLTGNINWTDNGTGFGTTGGSVSKSYTCLEAGNHNIVATVADSQGVTDTDTITITIVDPNLPTAPSNLTASVSGSTVNLNWQDNSSNESGFRVERKKKGSGLWIVIVNTGANVTSFADSPGKGNWEYRVRAFNASGDSASSNVVSVRIR